MINVDKKEKIDCHAALAMTHSCHPELVSGSHKTEMLKRVQHDMKSKFLVPQYLSALVPLKKAAFTLAEVLITLGIIGVVAAMTLPSVFEKHRKQVAISKLKKISSTISQASTRANVDYGEEREGFQAFNPDAAYDMFNKYYTPYMKLASVEKGQRGVFAYLYDGTALYFVKNVTNSGWSNTYIIACLTKKACKTLDETSWNTIKKGTGVERFTLYTSGRIPSYQAIVAGTTRDEFIEWCKNGSSIEACSAIIGGDGWQILDDYPLGF